MQSLLFAYLDEMLFHFSTDLFICKEVEIIELDHDTFRIVAIG
jgi:hypothetical protein